eukprot:gene16790-19968_t
MESFTEKMFDFQRRTTQAVLEKVGAAERTVDESFETNFSNFRRLGDFVSHLEETTSASMRDMEKMCQSNNALVTSLYNFILSELSAEDQEFSTGLLSKFFKKPTPKPSDDAVPSLDADQKAPVFQESVQKLYDAFGTVEHENLKQAMESIQYKVVNPIKRDEDMNRGTKQLLDRRKKLNLDYDSLKRSSDLEKVRQVKEEFESHSKKTNQHLQARSFIRCKLIVHSVLTLVQQFVVFFDSNSLLMEGLLGFIEPLVSTYQLNAADLVDLYSKKAPAPPPPTTSQQQSATSTPSPPPTYKEAVSNKQPQKQTPPSHSFSQMSFNNESPSSQRSSESPQPKQQDKLFSVWEDDSASAPEESPKQGSGSVERTTTFEEEWMMHGKASETTPPKPTPQTTSTRQSSNAQGQNNNNNNNFQSAFFMGSTPPASSPHVDNHQNERGSIEPMISERVRQWAEKNGRKNNIRTLLATLHEVLWEGSGWDKIGTGAVIAPPQVKKVYRKAVLIVHPDKVNTGTTEQKMIAQRIFESLKEGYENGAGAIDNSTNIVGPIEGTATSAAPVSTKFTCFVPNFSQRDAPFYTANYSVCGLTWRVYIFPKGNNSADELSIFLDLIEIKQPNYPCQKVNFTLEVANHKNPEERIRKPSDHVFTPKSTDWGFNKFMRLSQLHDPKAGFLKDDVLVISVEILNIVPETISVNGQRAFMVNSKKLTGFVGLKNQGATCYMNSLLQALYQISPFRKAVYELPTPESIDPNESIPLALQRVFYKLQFGSVAVSTKELTKSFGWGTHDIFTQHDVQELNRVLCDNLNDKMKGTKSEGTIESLFKGKIKNFIKCQKVKYESKREEEFFDLSLNVKGCSNILTSFDKYTEIEKLEGSNQYDAEGFGLQDADKGCKFLSFPPVLHLQLKRFEYDPVRDSNVKVNDKYTFPEVLDLSPYLDEEADTTIPSIYHLQGVLIHSGDLHNGHYYAFLKPKKDGEWLKFDDEDVTKCTFAQVSEESYGVEVEGTRRMPNLRNYTNGSDIEIPEHLKQRIDNDEKRLNSQHIRIRLTTDEDFSSHHTFDLVDFNRIQPQMILLKQNEIMNIAYLKNVNQKEMIPMRDKNLRQDIRLHLEVSYIPRPTDHGYLSQVDPHHGLVFFKYYDPALNTLQFVGSKVIEFHSKVSHIIPLLNQFVNQPLNTPLLVYEEMCEERIEPMKPSETFRTLEIENGDIIIFQKLNSIGEKFIYPTVVQYLEYIKHRIVVKFKQIETNNAPFTLELSKEMKYSEITKKISEQITADSDKIRLMSAPRFLGPDIYTPIKPNDNIPLYDILTSSNKLSDQLYFEVLTIPVSECENRRNFKIIWQKPNFEFEKVSVWVKKNGIIADIKLAFVATVRLTTPDLILDADRLNVLEIRNHGIERLYKTNDSLVTIMDYTTIKIEPFLEEQQFLKPSNHLVAVAHFTNEAGYPSYHGTPFLFIVKDEESVVSLRARLQARLGVTANEFARWKLAIKKDEKIEFLLEDASIVKGGDWSNASLALHHPVQNVKNQQKAIKIK